ncbi:MAG TPA: hypothetical protein PK079_26010 [Leptospiraceae bacterium]|nr:hypothetical protein [Leptospiraceae bacterium]HMX35315.1 hypothetical protein [Leptospiraceae bacterium]HMY29967.1 hypothetical protein [Leptospiraceae bacterium]HNE11599.1 hypothetical protein [Leptospiraceae bacterium]HNE56644.1 hypothetical protein [Leptospiraceae bacterium]
MKKKEPISLFNVFAEHSKDNHLGLKTKPPEEKEIHGNKASSPDRITRKE